MRTPGDGQFNYGDFDTLFVKIDKVLLSRYVLTDKKCHFHCCINSYWTFWFSVKIIAGILISCSCCAVNLISIIRDKFNGDDRRTSLQLKRMNLKLQMLRRSEKRLYYWPCVLNWACKKVELWHRHIKNDIVYSISCIKIPPT